MTIERRSDKHGPRLDEELHEETEALERGAPVEPRAEEWRQQEPAGDDEAEPDALLTTGLIPPGGLSHDDLEARSELATHLEPSRFPATKAGLLASAEELHAPERVLDLLRRLPEGERFENVQAVWAALGGPTERRS